MPYMDNQKASFEPDQMIQEQLAPVTPDQHPNQSIEPTQVNLAIPQQQTQMPSTQLLAPEQMAAPITAQQTALAAQGRAQMGAAKETANTLNAQLLTPEQTKAIVDKQNAAIEEQKQIKKEQDARTLALNKAVSDYDNKSIDSNHYMNSLSTGQRIQAAIGIFLGGIAGGENQALKIIHNQIENDIAAQKANLDKAGNTVAQHKGILADLRLKLGDSQAAEEAARAVYAGNIQNKLKAIAAKYQSPEIAAKADFAIQALEQGKRESMQKALENTKVQEMRSSLFGADGQTAQILSILPKEDRERFVQGPGFKGLANSTERAKTLQADANLAQSNISTIQDLIDIGKKSEREWVPSEASAVAYQLKSLLKGQLRTDVVGPGAMSESEMKIMDQVVANPTDVKQINALATLSKLKNVIQRNIQIKAKNEGMKVDQAFGDVTSARKLEGQVK